MTISGANQNYGIRGLAVGSFTLEYSTVSGTNGTAPVLAAPEEAGEGSVYFGNSNHQRPGDLRDVHEQRHSEAVGPEIFRSSTPPPA